MKALTYKQYRIFNICLLTFVYILIETVVTLSANIWFTDQLYALSLAIMFVSLEMMRWDGFAFVAVIASGITFCFASNASVNQYVIYCLGNCFMLLGLIFLRLIGKEKIRRNVGLTLVYVVLEYILAQVGRGIVSIIMMGSGPKMIIQFLTTDSMSLLFAIVAIFITRKIDGMFEDQKVYLKRLVEERQSETTGM